MTDRRRKSSLGFDARYVEQLRRATDRIGRGKNPAPLLRPPTKKETK